VLVMEIVTQSAASFKSEVSTPQERCYLCCHRWERNELVYALQLRVPFSSSPYFPKVYPIPSHLRPGPQSFVLQVFWTRILCATPISHMRATCPVSLILLDSW